MLQVRKDFGKRLSFAFLVVLLSLISACGGGGGKDEDEEKVDNNGVVISGSWEGSDGFLVQAVDAVVEGRDGKVYFSSGGEIYRFNDNTSSTKVYSLAREERALGIQYFAVNSKSDLFVMVLEGIQRIKNDGPNGGEVVASELFGRGTTIGYNRIEFDDQDRLIISANWGIVISEDNGDTFEHVFTESDVVSYQARGAGITPEGTVQACFFAGAPRGGPSLPDPNANYLEGGLAVSDASRENFVKTGEIDGHDLGICHFHQNTDKQIYIATQDGKILVSEDSGATYSLHAEDSVVDYYTDFSEDGLVLGMNNEDGILMPHYYDPNAKEWKLLDHQHPDEDLRVNGGFIEAGDSFYMGTNYGFYQILKSDVM